MPGHSPETFQKPQAFEDRRCLECQAQLLYWNEQGTLGNLDVLQKLDLELQLDFFLAERELKLDLPLELKKELELFLLVEPERELELALLPELELELDLLLELELDRYLW